mmetsp:Transcript_2007/g.1899  ORF Transcript_2007/g.1899 Transcript_2007/m.1899 type:complete len:93 (-) Transcript_2007:77-355(-)
MCVVLVLNSIDWMERLHVAFSCQKSTEVCSKSLAISADLRICLSSLDIIDKITDYVLLAAEGQSNIVTKRMPYIKEPFIFPRVQFHEFQMIL